MEEYLNVEIVKAGEKFGQSLRTSAIAVPGVAEMLARQMLRRGAQLVEQYHASHLDAVEKLREQDARKIDQVNAILAQYFLDPDPADGYDVCTRIAAVLDEEEAPDGEDG